MEKISMSVRIRLSAMMFLQFMMFAVWQQPLAAYLSGPLGLTGPQRSLILSTMAFGCLLAPLIGMIADRHFASQKVLAVLNLLGGLLLFWAASQKTPTMIFVALLLQQLCYMPTWGLTSAIAMSNSSTESFPRIRVFGSIGWVASGIFGWVALKMFGTKIDGTSIPLLCGGVTSLVAAVFALTLPDTPPPAKGQKSSIIDVLGLRSLTLMKDFGFATYIIITTLVMVPFTIYWSYGSIFLDDKGFKLIAATMNLGQVVEMFMMVLVPVVLLKLGIKWTMAIGLLALVVRYLFFLCGGLYDETWMYYGGILVHGIIFAFFFVGGQVYVDKKAPKELRAQAQGLIFLISFGIGMLAGNFFNGELIDRNSKTTIDVGTTFTLPADSTVNVAQPTVKGATIAQVKLYNRVLNDTEEEILASNNKIMIQNLIKEAKAKNIPVDTKAGLLYSGAAAGLKAISIPQQLTLACKIILPEDSPQTADDDTLSGVLFEAGKGKNSLKVALDKNILVLQAGNQRVMARTISITRGKDNPMFIAVTFDSRQAKFYINGNIYKIYNWKPIWSTTTIICVVLLLLFVAAFHYKENNSPGIATDK